VRLTKAVSYALLALSILEKKGEDEPITAKELARVTNLPPNYLTSILMTLVRAGILRSSRGVQRGFSLLGGRVTVRDVIEALEGPIVRIRPCERDMGAEERISRFLERRLAEMFSEIVLKDLVD